MGMGVVSSCSYLATHPEVCVCVWGGLTCDGTIYLRINQDTCLMQHPGVAQGTFLAAGGKRSQQTKLSPLKGDELLRRRVTGVLLFFFKDRWLPSHFLMEVGQVNG